MNELALARADGSYVRVLAKLARLDVLIVDDWGLAPVQDPERRGGLLCIILATPMTIMHGRF